jgi:hypothetical protein
MVLYERDYSEPRESRSGFENYSAKWMIFIHFVCIDILRCQNFEGTEQFI